MGLAILNELQNRLHTAAIAGVSIIGEDFRLLRTVEQFETAAKSSPILNKVYTQLLPLVSKDNQPKEQALLDAIGLVDAIVCTQASFMIDGELEPIGVFETRKLRQFKYSELEPLKMALTQKGSGRYEIVEKALNEKSPALNDFRVKPALIQALGDSYTELADLVQVILEQEGEAIIPILKYDFDPNGGREMVKRIELMEIVSGSKENDFYLAHLDAPSNVLKEACIKALKHSGINDEKLIELATTEKGSAKKTALYALGRLATPKSDAFWSTQLNKKNSNAESIVILNNSDVISDLLADKLDLLLDEILADNLSAKEKKVPMELCLQLSKVIAAIPNKSSQKMLLVLIRIAENQKKLTQLRDEKNQHLLNTLAYMTYDSGDEVQFMTVINNKICTGLAYSKDPKLIKFINQLYDATGRVYTTSQFIAQLISNPDGCYDYFEPDLKDQGIAKQILIGFCKIGFHNGFYTLNYRGLDDPYTNSFIVTPIAKTLDTRWFRLLLETNGVFSAFLLKKGFVGYNGKYILINLINPEDSNSLPMLQEYFYAKAKIGQGSYCLYALKECGWKEFNGLIPKYLEKEGNFSFYELQSLYRSMPMDKASKIKEIKQIAEKMISGKVSGSYKTEYTYVINLIEHLEQGYEL